MSRPPIGSPGDHPGRLETGEDGERGALDNETEKDEPESEGKGVGEIRYELEGGGPDEESENGDSDDVSDELDGDLGDGAQEVPTAMRKLYNLESVIRTPWPDVRRGAIELATKAPRIPPSMPRIIVASRPDRRAVQSTPRHVNPRVR